MHQNISRITYWNGGVKNIKTRSSGIGEMPNFGNWYYNRQFDRLIEGLD